jgi:hypothetical protein
MIKTSLAALGIMIVTVVSMSDSCGGPTGDRNPRPPTPTACVRNEGGEVSCPLVTGVQGVGGVK